MPENITVTEAARNFSHVINRVYYQHQTYLLTRGGTVVAKLSAAAEPLTGRLWLQSWANRPRLDGADAAAWAEDLAAAKAGLPQPGEDVWAS